MKKQEYIKRLGEWKWLIRERMINEGYKKYFVIKRSHLFIIDLEKKKKNLMAKRIELTRFLNSLNSLLTTIRGGQQVV